MRADTLYLTDIAEAAQAVSRFIGNTGEHAFIDDDLLKSAVLQKLLIIGEAAARLSEEFRARYPEIPWRDMAGFRNIAIHAYFAVDWSIVWTTATVDIPLLLTQIRPLLDTKT